MKRKNRLCISYAEAIFAVQGKDMFIFVRFLILSWSIFAEGLWKRDIFRSWSEERGKSIIIKGNKYIYY